MTLQPLRIDAGWQVNYNQFYEVDPISGYEHYFEGSSLLMLQNKARLKLIDVQWRPEGDLDGEYQVSVLNFLENFNTKTNGFDIDTDWEQPFLSFSTKSRLALVEKLEELMRTLPVFIDPRMTLKRGVIDELSESYRLEFEEHGFSADLIQNILKNGNAKIQNLILDSEDITREILLEFTRKGITKKVKNKATQKLNSKRFKK